MKKKTTRAHDAKPEPRGRRALRLSSETVRVLNSTDLARAASGCDTTSFPTQNCTYPDGGGGGAVGG